MENTVAARLVKLRKILGLNQGQFASKINMKQQALSNVEHMRSNLLSTTVRLICITFDINEQWLLEGIGDIFVNKRSAEEREFLNIYNAMQPTDKKELLNYGEYLLQKRALHNKSKLNSESEDDSI
ncbi:MAG: helix-turn-helix domain-containing protein [Treponema sp.]|jgi:transcriptional regulator with XRE-family HTH domain|nr:helix-turn-helix domain-containing protein [Treponema sp.]